MSNKENPEQIFSGNITENLDIYQQAILFDKNVWIEDNKLYRKTINIPLFWDIFNAMKAAKLNHREHWMLYDVFKFWLTSIQQVEIEKYIAENFINNKK